MKQVLKTSLKNIDWGAAGFGMAFGTLTPLTVAKIGTLGLAFPEYLKTIMATVTITGYVSGLYIYENWVKSE